MKERKKNIEQLDLNHKKNLLNRNEMSNKCVTCLFDIIAPILISATIKIYTFPQRCFPSNIVFVSRDDQAQKPQKEEIENDIKLNL